MSSKNLSRGLVRIMVDQILLAELDNYQLIRFYSDSVDELTSSASRFIKQNHTSFKDLTLKFNTAENLWQADIVLLLTSQEHGGTMN